LTANLPNEIDATLLTWLLFDPESRLKPPSTLREFESFAIAVDRLIVGGQAGGQVQFVIGLNRDTRNK